VKAMVLAAGEGRRLRPITDKLPKPMVPLGGRPLLEYTVQWLRRYEVRDLVINLHYYPDVVRQHFGDGSAYDVSITYSYEPELLGTAGAIAAVAPLFEEERFLIVYGDNLSTCDLSRLIAFHGQKGGVATLAVHFREDVSQSGMVVLDEEDRVLSFREKPDPSEVTSHWANGGLIVAEPALLQYIPKTGFSDLSRDTLPACLADGQALYGYRMVENLWWADSLEDYRRLERLMASGEIVL